MSAKKQFTNLFNLKAAKLLTMMLSGSVLGFAISADSLINLLYPAPITIASDVSFARFPGSTVLTEVMLKNNTRKSVRVMGMVRTDCQRSMLSNDLPIDLQPFESRPVKILFSIHNSFGTQWIPLQVFTNRGIIRSDDCLKIVIPPPESGTPTPAPEL